MALITSLPATIPSYLLDWMFPMIPAGQVMGAIAGQPEFKMIRPYAEISAPGQLVWAAGSSAGAGTNDVLHAPLGNPGRGFTTTIVNIHQAHSAAIPWQTLAPADFAPGYENPDIQRVQIWDMRWHTNIAAGAPFTNGTGFLFLPYLGTAITATSWPGTAGPILGGFGIIGRNLAGAQAWQYRSFAHTTGAVLDTVDIAPAVIPDQQEWTHAQFIFRASGPGREALLSLNVNGVGIFADRQFGSAQLQRVRANGNANMYSFVPDVRVSDITGERYTFTIRVRCGKFLLDGTEVRF